MGFSFQWQNDQKSLIFANFAAATG